MNNTYLYILIMAITVFIIRVLPLTLLRKQINDRLIKDFLYYLPYVTLTVMTFPSMIFATNDLLSGVFAFVIGSFLAYKEYGLFKVTIICCLSVFILELLK